MLLSSFFFGRGAGAGRGGGLSGHRKGFSRILGSSEQPVKMSLPLRVGGGGGVEKKLQRNAIFFGVLNKCSSKKGRYWENFTF